MSRLSGADIIEIRPRNNVYTALSAAGTIAVIVGLLALYARISALGVKLF